jgi:hypothetical protein
MTLKNNIAILACTCIWDDDDLTVYGRIFCLHLATLFRRVERREVGRTSEEKRMVEFSPSGGQLVLMLHYDNFCAKCCSVVPETLEKSAEKNLLPHCTVQCTYLYSKVSVH